jgi:hypothetical protein
VEPFALQTGLPLPAGDGALIEIEGGDDGLHRAAVGKQRHDCEHQPLRLVHPIEGGVSSRREGATASLTLVSALFSAMDHYVSLARTTVGAAASVVTPLSVRVHADTLLFGGQRPNKGAAGPARSSTQPSSTVPWGATPNRETEKNPLTHRIEQSIQNLCRCRLRLLRQGQQVHFD